MNPGLFLDEVRKHHSHFFFLGRINIMDVKLAKFKPGAAANWKIPLSSPVFTAVNRRSGLGLSYLYVERRRSFVPLFIYNQ